MLVRIWIYLSLTLVSTTAFSRSHICTQFLETNYELNVNDLSKYFPYVETSKQLRRFATEESVRKIVTLFNNFKEGYHDRYNAFVDQLLLTNPKLENDIAAFKEATNVFTKQEAYYIELFQKFILKMPAKKRVHYLRSLSPERLRRDSLLLDALFGIGTSKLTDYTHTQWESLVRFIYAMDLPVPKQTVAMDLTGANGTRFSLLMSVMHAESQVISVVSNSTALRFYNEIIRKSGIQNVRYITESELPQVQLNADASFIYLFNKQN